MKRTLIMAAIGATTFFCAQNAAAEDLVVKTGSGSTKFALTDVTSLKFNEGKLQVFTSASETPTEFNLADIESLKFDGVTQGIQSTMNDKKFNLTFSNGILSATGLEGARTAVYDISGKRMLDISSWDGSAVSLQNLTNGVYVIKINNQTFKFIKK